MSEELEKRLTNRDLDDPMMRKGYELAAQDYEATIRRLQDRVDSHLSSHTESLAEAARNSAWGSNRLLRLISGLVEDVEQSIEFFEEGEYSSIITTRLLLGEIKRRCKA